MGTILAVIGAATVARWVMWAVDKMEGPQR